jgi:5-(carboxyamino)imidazole ribonucleotide synthase
MTTEATVVGIVGGGQLARMLVQAAPAAGVECVVLARPTDESVADLGVEVIHAETVDHATLAALAARVDVVTFDHEPTDLAAVEAIEAAGVLTRPSSTALRFADKAHQRTHLAAAGVPVPPFAVVDGVTAVEKFAATHGWPVVCKAPLGGYDGRGVWVLEGPAAADEHLTTHPGTYVVEPHLPLSAEAAALVVTGATGEVRTYPIVDTLQRDGICVQVTVPSALPPHLVDRCGEVARAVAEVVGAIGILAVELFVVGDEVLVNEIAPRTHNSGHLTIEACATSQFENHLRAVAGLPLGPTDLVVQRATMVNLLGDDPVPEAGPEPGTVRHVHRYGKTPRPGRKVGHVTTIVPRRPT